MNQKMRIENISDTFSRSYIRGLERVSANLMKQSNSNNRARNIK